MKIIKLDFLIPYYFWYRGLYFEIIGYFLIKGINFGIDFVSVLSKGVTASTAVEFSC